MNKEQRKLIDRLARSFQSTYRNGDLIVISTNEDLRDIVKEFHGTHILPDDYRFEVMSQIIKELEFNYLDAELGEISDRRDEIINDIVDIYTAELTEWLASHLERVEYCNNAKVDNLPPDADMSAIMGMGQYLEIDEILSNLLEILESLE